MLEPAIRDLASSGRNFVTVCVSLPNGDVASHVMWVDADDEHLIFNTEVHRAEYRAIRTDPKVTTTVLRADDPYASAEVRGTVVETITGAAARTHIDAPSQRYFGKDDDNEITSERVIVEVAPDRQRTVHL